MNPGIYVNDLFMASEKAEASGVRDQIRMSLDSLPVGTHARVIAINGSGAIARRLMEMGIVPGAPVCVIRTAPLGDPLEVRVRSYHLALRRAEARLITVTTGKC